jgi:hypothetical protein
LAKLSNSKVATLLKKGLERTFSQVRQVVGTIERDDDGDGYSIVRKKNTTVQFVVQHLDTPQDSFPSYAEIAKANFLSPVLGDIEVLCNKPMTVGNKPECQPDNSPTVMSFKANFIPGGLIFIGHSHHWCNGLTGGNALYKQLAGNCYAIAHTTEFPSWDFRCLDRRPYGIPGFEKVSSSQKAPTNAPPRPHANLQHKPSQSVMFHLRKSKARELKAAASPSDGTPISTYNAVCALMWRVLCKLREPLYKPSLDSKPLWGEGVSIGKMYNDPPIPAGMQGNLQFDITSEMSSVPQLTLAEIISDAPLSKLALYTRQMTDSVTKDMLAQKLQSVAHIRNKQELSIHVDSFVPLSLLLADWRYSAYCTYDFGFGKPDCYRHLWGAVALCLAVVYPPHNGPAGEDEGLEVQFAVETELVPALKRDPEWSRYFEWRGVDVWDEESLKMERAKL